MPTVEEIDAKIRELEEQKQKLREAEKQKHLDKANAAIEELRKLGYNYRLAEMETGSRSRAPTTGGTRRTGIREQVLEVVKTAGMGGVARAQVLTALDAADKSAQQSVSNALAALKKAGTITLANGLYKPA